MGVEFSKDNQPDERKPRGKGKKSLMLEAIRDVCKDEQEFLKQMVTIGIGGLTKISAPDADEEEFEYKNPNPTLLTLVLNRIEPPLKAIAPMVEFEFDPNLNPHEKADQILTAIADGKLAPDIGQMIITSITSMLKIQEVTDIEERLKKMEAELEQAE